ncbi:constitutive coactivator of PPAR-gamma-like protein 2, partial [Polyodon spathula]|uniref:constitutive coactivator of PPAR-gamma-like protein 2 n=1 Tax=Polyodon spathula TaxID=7913 RepID=UPI001B7F6B77
QGFQEYVEKRCPGAAVPVDLLKLSRTVARQHPQHPQHPSPAPPPPARVLIDADSGLQRLYGGYQTDWACGGQWNAMLGYLAALSQACLYQGGLELAVVFNGTLGKDRWPEWAKRAQGERQTAQLIVNHVANKETPPPRAWFLPPACLSHCIRLAMIRFRVRVVQTLEDHHQEALSLYRDGGFQGLIAHDSEFALCSVPAYFSSHALKLSWNGKNLTTNQYLLPEVAKQLGLRPGHLPAFAALLGNHILPDEDLAAFHWSLLGPDHPLASLKVHAHQLVLPPCEVVIKAVSEYVSSIKDLSNLDAVGRDVFKQSQSRTEDKVQRFKKAVEYFSSASKPRPLSMGPSPYLFPGFGQGNFGGPPSHMGAMQPNRPLFPPPQVTGGKLAYQSGSFPGGPPPPLLFPPHPLQECSDGLKPPFSDWAAPYDSATATGTLGHRQPNHHAGPTPGPASSPSSSSEGEEPNGASANHVPDRSSSKGGPHPPRTLQGSPWLALHQEKTRGHQDALRVPVVVFGFMATGTQWTSPTTTCPGWCPGRAHRVMDHYPHIYHVLTKGELKIPVCIEDECTPELPPAALLFRSARQLVYGVLFSLAETQRRGERLSLRRRLPVQVPPVIIKEWSSNKARSALTPELVPALTFREWTCPNLRKLWLGRAVEDKNRRMRAFLACLKSDSPGMLNPASIPTHLLLLCCVLRYMLQWPGGRVLQRHELDAFLAQAVSSQLYDPDQLQELKIEKLDSRGVQLAALFMSGVDTALFVNDACGQPVPWEHCCPWIYFDGKLFQSKLGKAARERGTLLELCEGQVDQAAKVEKMRQAILEGINILGRSGGEGGVTEGDGKGIQAIPPQGGKLEIAGMVVGQWAGNKPFRGRGGFNMQVVSVGGGGRGRGREQPGKQREGKKQTTGRVQLSPGPASNGTPKLAEGSKGRGSSAGGGVQQLNGSAGLVVMVATPPGGQEEEVQPAQTHSNSGSDDDNSAFALRDSDAAGGGASNDSSDTACCHDDRLGGATSAFQKEE